MPIPAKADGNVPLRPGRSWFQPVGTTAAWVYHKLAGGGAIDGSAPTQDTETDIDPVVVAGRLEYQDLTKGGMFTLQAKSGQAIVVEAVDLGGGTLTICTLAAPTTPVRTTPTAPFKVAPGEVLRVNGGTGCGLLLRLDGDY